MDIKRFTEYYNEYSRLVMKVAYSVLKDFDLAQDVCQDTFIKLYEQRNELDETTVKAWLVICAKRRAVDYCRKINKQKELKDAVEGNAKKFSKLFSDDVADLICGEELTMEFFVKLWNESPEWFEIITRICINNEDPQNVARDLEMSIANLRTKLHRARKWARKELQNKN